MTILFLLIAIAVIWKVLPAVFEFIIGMFIFQLIWQVIKFIAKAGVVLLLLALVFYFICR
jgi:hypothetical protein